MKRLFLLLIFPFAISLSAQTNNAENTKSAVICDSLNTLYAYTYLNHGAMFNVVASAAITLDYINANLINGTNKYYIYYKTGGYTGYETNAAAWTFIDSATVSSNNTQTISNLPTKIPITLNILMTVGDTVALYLTTKFISKVYLTSTNLAFGAIYASNSDLKISVARGIYQYHGVPFSTPQIWNGTVSYCNGPTSINTTVSTSSKNQFSAFAAGGYLQIALEEELLSKNQNLVLELFDILHKKIVSKEVNVSKSTIDISMLSKGIYFCSLKNSSNILFTRKIVVE
jgi:hypothetical protein